MAPKYAPRIQGVYRDYTEDMVPSEARLTAALVAYANVRKSMLRKGLVPPNFAYILPDVDMQKPIADIAQDERFWQRMNNASVHPRLRELRDSVARALVTRIEYAVETLALYDKFADAEYQEWGGDGDGTSDRDSRESSGSRGGRGSAASAASAASAPTRRRPREQRQEYGGDDEEEDSDWSGVEEVDEDQDREDDDDWVPPRKYSRDSGSMRVGQPSSSQPRAARVARASSAAAAASGDWGATENVYKVERILERRRRGRGYAYLVKWLGYPDSENTWEPRTRLMRDVPELVESFDREN